MTPPVALTIAGSDSGGGAGIQADLKTFTALGVFGTTAVTALTAQNTVGVAAVHVAPVGIVDAQIDAVLEDFAVAAVKTGMLATAEIVALVARRARAGELPDLVVDPVMVSASGDRLLDPEAERRYLHDLFPHAAVVTPNMAEASALLGREVRTLADVRAAARDLGQTSARAVIVTGGHLEGDAVDVLWDGGDLVELRAERVDTDNVHGTGCTFASAIAAHLALGAGDVRTAAERAKAYLTRALVAGSAWKLGAGHGPVDHRV